MSLEHDLDDGPPTVSAWLTLGSNALAGGTLGFLYGTGKPIDHSWYLLAFIPAITSITIGITGAREEKWFAAEEGMEPDSKGISFIKYTGVGAVISGFPALVGGGLGGLAGLVYRAFS